MILTDKDAVVHGAGGAIGSAVADAFEREGARVFRAGRRGSPDVAEVDARDERAVDDHLRSVVDEAGHLDICFDAAGLPNRELLGLKEALTRDLSAELAPHGLRVVGLRPQAMPATRTIRDAYEPRAAASGLSWEQWQDHLASRTHPRRLMTTAELADVAAFVAGDRASALTGTIVNLTMGSLDD